MNNQTQKIELCFIGCCITISAAIIILCYRLNHNNIKDNPQSDSISAVDKHRKVPHPIILPIHNGNTSTPIIIYH